MALHNLTDLLLWNQIKEIRTQLCDMRGYLINAELSNDPNAVEWATKYLNVLFSAEDNIDNYVPSLAAPGKSKIGFFQRRAHCTLFAAFYDSCCPAKKLRRELNHLEAKIGKLERERPAQVVDASLPAGNPSSDEHETGKGNCTTTSYSDHGIRSLGDQLHLDVPTSLLPAEMMRSKSMNSFPSNRRSRCPGAIRKLTNLKFLCLKSKDQMGRPSKIDLLPLSELSQLSHVSLLGNIGRLPPLNEFPPNLKILALSVSRLNDDPMLVLSKLPNLSVLRLLADSYLGTKMECPRNGFKNLRVLKLWMLKELDEWTVEEGGMPLLKELFIRYCLKLKQLPIQLLHQDALEELTLTAMPEEFVEQVKQKLQSKQKYTVLNLNNYKFTPLPWENDPDLWNEAGGTTFSERLEDHLSAANEAYNL